jgi:hypothetical protein
MRGFAALALAVIVGCGGAVTDPTLEGFDHDPRPIAGVWVTEVREPSGQARTLEAELFPAGGAFLGTFEFFVTGRQWRVQFQDGRWDGIRIRFTTLENVDPPRPPLEIDWIATYLPATQTDPAHLLLTSPLFLTPIVYVRP